jgi:hypothetical protein
MLSTAQIDYFRTFGFAVLSGLLDPGRTSALRSEVDAALRDAYAATYDERVLDGISGHYLPMASRQTPVSTSLVCDDPTLIGVAEQLLGGPVVPECPEGVLYFADAGWHNDDGTGVTGVKLATYFDRLDAGNGALRFLPGSHTPEQTARLAAFRARRQGANGEDDERAACPGFVAASRPGDVLAFDLHTWHASFGGRDRLAWTIVYLRCPETAEEEDRTRRSMADSFEQAFRGFDRDRYPIWRDWLAQEAAHPRRGAVIERLRATGALDLPGAEVGW